MIGNRLVEKLKEIAPRLPGPLYRGALVSLVVLALVIPLALVAVPFIEFFNGMAAQPKGKTQGTYGRVHGTELPVERPPVQGTVPRSWNPYRFDHKEATLEAAREVGELLGNPLRPDMENLQRGRELYEIYCIACHGNQGAGDGPVTGPDRYPAPPSLHTDQAREYADGTIFHIISKGAEKMPGYAEKIDLDERWTVVNYLRALQRANQPEPEDMEP